MKFILWQASLVVLTPLATTYAVLPEAASEELEGRIRRRRTRRLYAQDGILGGPPNPMFRVKLGAR
jgi:hypothetical protein